MQERAAFRSVTQRVTNCVPTQRVGTRKKYLDAYLFPFPLGRDKACLVSTAKTYFPSIYKQVAITLLSPEFSLNPRKNTS